MSKIDQIIIVVRGSLIFDAPMAEYETARAIRDANRCGTTAARFSAARRATQRTRLTVTLDAGMGIIRIRNNASGLEYTMHP